MTTKTTNRKCAHCLLDVKENSAVKIEKDGETLYFCCHGCLSVYGLIHNAGLDSFYIRRTDWKEGGVDSARISDELFEDDLTEADGECSLDVVLSGVRCSSCIWLVENFFRKDENITYVRVNYATHKARVRWKKGSLSLSDMLEKFRSLGYPPMPAGKGGRNSVLEEERRDYFYRFSVGSFFAMNVMLYTFAMYAGYFHGMDDGLKKFFKLLSWALATPVMFYSGYPFIINSFKSVRNRVLNMDVLVFLGSFSSYIYSVSAVFGDQEVYFDTTCMIITLILLGRFIETGAKLRHSGAVTRLLSYQPQTVRLIRDFEPSAYAEGRLEAVLIPVKSVKTGDFLEVLPGSSVPADGQVIHGESEVDESMLTGEASPVFKTEGADVFAGTSNLNGNLVIECFQAGNGTVLSRIVKAVEEAQAEKAPIQNLADSLVGWFVPVIITIAAGTFCWWYFRSGSGLEGLMNAVSVLVIACPCALGLATPLAVMISTTKTASFGALVRSGEVMETLSHINCWCFDKTGTITRGEMKVADIYDLGSGRTLALAASAERFSSHLISKAVTDYYDGEFLPAENFREIPGNGVEADINGKRVRAGKLKFIAEYAEVTSEMREQHDYFSAKGHTVAAVAEEDELIGFILLSDSVREEAGYTLTELMKRRNRVLILTGDSRKAADKLISALGADGVECLAEVTPFEKAETIRKLRQEGYKVAMVGDGINDAPALTEADAGIAMGKGTDIAIESADAVLMRGDLSVILKLNKTAKKTFTIIKENLFWAFSYNFIAVPLAVTGKIHPIFSAAFMAVSSLIVVFNSMRINSKD
ncbi:heavy metal translocating P-type ATPase [Geovibrio thiophilus]|uniref:Heavy metal translocating P-type ATPase n=1 Tax=Geovibrio thiophilus TaxID=139438 RepID=A0A3R5YYE1_9BACT|nr:heavy metal translocating P-type ATPase [Geovibrio thiophilus]QAR32479.1 heavy metal translocating P-type ATPase [Geovibrio thiophilus]